MADPALRQDRGLRRCYRCERYTSRLEAEQRVFNTGSCACGGALQIVLERPMPVTVLNG
jgi:hypothetical protein